MMIYEGTSELKMVDLLKLKGRLTETQYLDAKMLLIQYCDKQYFSNSCHNKENNMSARRQGAQY